MMEDVGVWDKIGEVGVNTGLIWVGDAVDVLPDGAPNPSHNGDEFRRRLENEGYTKEWHDDQGQGIGLTGSNFGGDGSSSVYVRYDDMGRVLELRINFEEHWERVWRTRKEQGVVPEQPDHPEVSSYRRIYDFIADNQREAHS